MKNPTSLAPMLISEFLGTMILVVLIDGVVGSAVLLNKQADWIVITTGCALAVSVGVYISGRLSGGHLNPAVTLALVMRREFPARRLAPYWVAQLAGAFVGAAIIYYNYGRAFDDFERTHAIVRGAMVDGKLAGPSAGGAGVFVTFPAFDDAARNLFSEVFGTALLLFAIRAITDHRNAGVPRSLQPVMIGAVVWAIGLSLGGLTGFALNPARDLGPRLAAALFGWGPAVFRSHSWYFWVPIAGPLLGGLLGATAYDLLIADALPREDAPEKSDVLTD